MTQAQSNRGIGAQMASKMNKVPTLPQREAPTPHRFQVQMFDFSCEGLVAGEKCEPYLKIDFVNFKSFKTDTEANSVNPEWGFKAGFHYELNYLERLNRCELTTQCFNRATGQAIGKASIDLQTIACGPVHYKLTLRDHDEPRGTLNFTCIMKMISPNLTVICKDLSLTMQGCPAPARMQIYSTLAEDGAGAKVPHSRQGVWEGPCSLTFRTTLADLLKGPAYEGLRFQVIDEMDMRQGEAVLEFRKAFSIQPDAEIKFKVPVTYTPEACAKQEAEKPAAVGSVGELAGNLVYQNVPIYAQMAGGACVDGHVEGGLWLFDGLPYPHSMQQPPPLWQDPADRSNYNYNYENLGADLQPHDDTDSKFDDFDDKAMWEKLELIDLPPPWEKKRERAGDRCRTAYVDPRSRRTTWKDPRFLPENWDQRIDAQTGKVYFKYHKTRQTTYVDPRSCLPGWDMRLSKEGDIYFAYLPAMQTTFIDPRGLPDYIDAALDDEGRMYFKNHETKTTSWEDPRNAQQEVTLTMWRQAQNTRWWKEQVWRESEELLKQRYDLDEHDDDESEVNTTA